MIFDAQGGRDSISVHMPLEAVHRINNLFNIQRRDLFAKVIMATFHVPDRNHRRIKRFYPTNDDQANPADAALGNGICGQCSGKGNLPDGFGFTDRQNIVKCLNNAQFKTVVNSRSFANAYDLAFSQIEENRIGIGTTSVDTDTINRITGTILHLATSLPKFILHFQK
jgi:hypothetical protein